MSQIMIELDQITNETTLNGNKIEFNTELKEGDNFMWNDKKYTIAHIEEESLTSRILYVAYVKEEHFRSAYISDIE